MTSNAKTEKRKEKKPANSGILTVAKGLSHAIFFILLLAISMSAVFLILFDLNFSGKIYPRVSVAGKNISNISPKTAQQLIDNEIFLWHEQKIPIDYSQIDGSSTAKKWQFEPEMMGFLPSASKTTLAAYNYGRTGNPIKMLREKIQIITKGKDLPVYYDFSENKFNDYFDKNFSFLEKPSKDASIVLAGENTIEISAQNGYKIDRSMFKKEVASDIEMLDLKPLSLKLAASTPDVTDDETGKAKEQADVLLNSKVSLHFEDKSWTLDPNLIKSSIEFEPIKTKKGNTILGLKINPKPIIDYLENLQFEINREPTNAVFGEKDGSIIVVSGGETGAVLGLDKSAQKIADEMAKGAGEGNKDIAVRLIIEEKDPDINMKTLSDLGINALVGQGKSNFAGSPKNRKHNIKVGSAKFNNVIIKPDEEFSFVETLGEITVKAGYLAELVIKGDRTVPELGGGICQVSTTAFRAAIYSGLPITERKAHSYAVSYYAPHGMDSTIYPPHPDLRFKNDTGGNILIQTMVVNNDVTFNFFGVKQNRTIKIIGPKTYDRQANGAMKAVFWREIYSEDGKLAKKESFYSNYASPNNYPRKNPLE